MGNRQDRLTEIINLLRAHNGHTVRELALTLNVSSMTIRRDIAILENQGFVKGFHGSVVYNQEQRGNNGEDEYSIPMASARNIRQKQSIARRAVAMIEPGDALIMDIGSTVEEIARSLPVGIPLTITCYGLNILREVSRRAHTDLFFAGGRYHEDTQMFESNEGREMIRHNRATKAFVSAAGVHMRLGITTVNQYESKTKRAVLDSSLMRILVVDSSKFGKVYPAHFADLKEFDVVVTDNALDEEYKEAFSKLGVELTLV